jgi:hypothetical protein
MIDSRLPLFRQLRRAIPKWLGICPQTMRVDRTKLLGKFQKPGLNLRGKKPGRVLGCRLNSVFHGIDGYAKTLIDRCLQSVAAHEQCNASVSRCRNIRSLKIKVSMLERISDLHAGLHRCGVRSRIESQRLEFAGVRIEVQRCGDHVPAGCIADLTSHPLDDAVRRERHIYCRISLRVGSRARFQLPDFPSELPEQVGSGMDTETLVRIVVAHCGTDRRDV